MPRKIDDDVRALRILKEMLEMGVIPKGVTVGDVEIQVHSIDRARPEGERIEPRASSYLEQRLAEARLERIKSKRRDEA